MMKCSFRSVLGGLTRACVCGVLTGTCTAVIIMLYKICAKAVITFSEYGYGFLRKHMYGIPAILIIFVGIAAILAYIYRKNPSLQGGGIPTSIGILRGKISFTWFKTLIGTFALSLITFLIGVPLGNEGPSVQMGTAVGRGVTCAFPQSQRALDRYAMTGGACAGFSSATGAPISGILFTIEEAHGQFSPLVLLVCAVSVFTARVVNELLSPICGVSVGLFPDFQPITLPAKDIWLPIVVGVTIGLFSVALLKYYQILLKPIQRLLQRGHQVLLLCIIFTLSMIAGLFSSACISTGHELVLDLFIHTPLMPLLAILAVRATLTLGANAVGITGGMFVPLLTLGAVCAAILAAILQLTVGLSAEDTVLVLLLGITACIAGTMKMPLTAMVFAVEALSCHTNILAVIIVTVTAFGMTELFGVRSVNEHVLDGKLETLHAGKTAAIYDTFVTVQPSSFAVGKEIRDILWPANLFVLSIQHDPTLQAQTGELANKKLLAGDILHVRYTTFDEAETKQQLIAIVGAQQYAETQIDSI